jgi:hypothetical protein
MSYDFWVDINAAGDLGSGCTQDLTPAWTGTVDISGTAVTAVTGGNFPTALFDGKHFLRVDPDGAGDANIRIASGDDTTLVLSESGGTLTGATANIGGAFKTPEKAIGTSLAASKIPYANGTSINSDINIYVKAGTYIIAGELKVASSTQDTVKLRRRIKGIGGFSNGVFSGPIFDISSSSTYRVILGADEVSFEGISVLADENTYCVNVATGKSNIFISNIQTWGGNYSINGGTGACANIIECRFNAARDTAIQGYNMYIVRCVADGCKRAWGGQLSSYHECVEKNTTTNPVYFNAHPACSDFSYCRFMSDKPFSITNSSSVIFNKCTFDHDLDLSSISGVASLKDCIVGGQFTGMTNPELSVYSNENVTQLAGIDDFSKVFNPAFNTISKWPDPVFDKFCRFSTAGPHEYRFPVDAVGARALRNRQRVSLTEVGL